MNSVNRHDGNCGDIQAKEADDNRQSTLLIQPRIQQTNVTETICEKKGKQSFSRFCSFFAFLTF